MTLRITWGQKYCDAYQLQSRQWTVIIGLSDKISNHIKITNVRPDKVSCYAVDAKNYSANKTCALLVELVRISDCRFFLLYWQH